MTPRRNPLWNHFTTWLTIRVDSSNSTLPGAWTGQTRGRRCVGQEPSLQNSQWCLLDPFIVSVYTYVCIYIYTVILYTSDYIQLHIYIYIYLQLYIYIYIYTYNYRYTIIHIYIYIYTIIYTIKSNYPNIEYRIDFFYVLGHLQELKKTVYKEYPRGVHRIFFNSGRCFFLICLNYKNVTHTEA